MKTSLYSTSPISGKKYTLPTENDKSTIDNFIAKNKGKKVVVVQGLGFVGAVMTLICSNALTEEYAVIGIDLANENSYWKIASINEGVFPVIASDPKINQFHEKTKLKDNLLATYDNYAYSIADIVIVDINLDVAKNADFSKKLIDYDVDLTPFKKGLKAIGNNCKENVLVLVETTVPPGTCAKVAYPIIKDCLEKRGLSTDRFRLGHSYERVMPGPDYIDSIQNFYRVFSGINEESADETEKFLRTIISTKKYPLTRLGNTNATEMAKVLENSYRAMNIAFIVEWSRFAELAGVNLYEVVNAIRMRPTHSNLMLPGIGVGGYCLTKDPLLASWSKQNLFMDANPLMQSEKSVQINDQMPLFAFNYLKETFNNDLSGKKALLLGVSYRSDVADTRYTPVEPFYDYLKSQGAEIALHDPYVDVWEEKSLTVSSDLENLLKEDFDIVAFCTNHSEYIDNKTLIQSISEKSNLFIFDTIGVLNQNEINLLKQNHLVKVVGRGDV
ncbi:nucleotide sugar dehydrogenase [Flaviramulus aquimarinus]|uniref:Nucleotide sugar dehydrogenase n=1 Tax=Flaviramulus aquimarinus TaxID=1170456 RepID=A0ABP9EN69_9FLAO